MFWQMTSIILDYSIMFFLGFWKAKMIVTKSPQNIWLKGLLWDGFWSCRQIVDWRQTHCPPLWRAVTLECRMDVNKSPAPNWTEGLASVKAPSFSLKIQGLQFSPVLPSFWRSQTRPSFHPCQPQRPLSDIPSPTQPFTRPHKQPRNQPTSSWLVLQGNKAGCLDCL